MNARLMPVMNEGQMSQHSMLGSCDSAKTIWLQMERKIARTRACACDDGGLAGEGESHLRALSRPGGTLEESIENGRRGLPKRRPRRVLNLTLSINLFGRWPPLYLTLPTIVRAGWCGRPRAQAC